MWNGSSWSALGDGAALNKNGVAFSSGANSRVAAIAASGSDIYAGGFFDEARTSAGNMVHATNIARWNGNSWAALGDGSDANNNGLGGIFDVFFTINGVGAIAAAANGSIYVGGGFQEARTSGANKVAANNIARWDGSAWSALGDGSLVDNNGVAGSVYALAVSGNEVYVGGRFYAVKNSAASIVNASNVARWNGSSWSALGDGSSLERNGVHVYGPDDPYCGIFGDDCETPDDARV